MSFYNRMTMRCGYSTFQKMKTAWDAGDIAHSLLSDRELMDWNFPDTKTRESNRRHYRCVVHGDGRAVGPHNSRLWAEPAELGWIVYFRWDSGTLTPRDFCHRLYRRLAVEPSDINITASDAASKIVWVWDRGMSHQYNVVANEQWISRRVPTSITEECDLYSWAEEEGG